MSDLAVINIEVVYDNTPMDKFIKSTAAAEAMVKRLNDAEKAHLITLDEGVRGLQEVETFLKKNSVAMQDSIRLEKESARVAKENATIKAQAIKDLSNKAETAFALTMQRLKEEASERAIVAAAEKREADQLEYLNQKYLAGYTALQKYKAEENDLNLALKRDVLTATEHKAAMDKLHESYANGTGIFAKYSEQVANKSSKIGLVLQQAGYQVGDFLVQVQSGTNIFVAFGQQMTQMVGVVSYFTEELAVAFGVTEVAIAGFTLGLSIAVPVIALVGQALTRNSEGSKKAKEEVDLYTKAVSALASEIQKNQDKFALLKFGGDQGVASSKQEAENLVREIAKARQDLIDQATKAPRAAGVGAADFARTSVNADAKEKLDALRASLDVIKAQDEAQRMLNGGLSVAGGLQKAWLLTQQESKRTQEEANGLIADANQKAIYNETQALAVKDQELKLQQLTLEYGKNSNQVMAQKAEMASLAAEQSLKEKFAKDGISAAEQKIIDQASAQAYLNSQNASLLEQQTQNAQNLASAFKDVSAAMKGMISFGEGLDKALDAATVKAGLLKKGIDASTAGTISGMQADLNQKMEAANKAGINPSILSGMFGGDQAKIDQLTKQLAENQATESASHKHGPSEDSLKNKLEALYKYLDATKEVAKYLVDAENLTYQEREDSLKAALDRKIITVTQYNDLEKDLTIKHQQELANIERMRQTTQIKDAGTFFGGMADLAKAGGDKTAKAVRIFSAAQALTNSYLAFTQILADPSLIGRPWARFGMAASALASGLSAVANIKSGGGGSISAGGSNPSSVGSSGSMQTATPQTVMIQGIKPTDIFTGEQLSTLFDSLYKENRNRGMVFQVAR